MFKFVEGKGVVIASRIVGRESKNSLSNFFDLLKIYGKTLTKLGFFSQMIPQNSLHIVAFP